MTWSIGAAAGELRNIPDLFNEDSYLGVGSVADGSMRGRVTGSPTTGNTVLQHWVTGSRSTSVWSRLWVRCLSSNVTRTHSQRIPFCLCLARSPPARSHSQLRLVGEGEIEGLHCKRSRAAVLQQGVTKGRVRAGYALDMPSCSSTDTMGMTAHLDQRKKPISSLGSSKKLHADTPHTHKGRAALCTNSTCPATQIFAMTVLDPLLDPIHLACSNNSCYRSFGGQSPMKRPTPCTNLTHPAPWTFIVTFLCAPFVPIDLASSGDPCHRTSNPTGERLLELHPSGDKLTQTISLWGMCTTTHSHHVSSSSATMDYAHSIHAHTRQGNESPPTGGFSLSGHKPEMRVASLAKFRGYNQNVRKHRFCSSYPPGIQSPNDTWMFWKKRTHGSGTRRLCKDDKYKCPMKSLQ
ncbi:hypothetical protein DFH09DRAFT_1104328 [Mycena vulgaris]|nr:hypothetical protein DFH09DRAFT_1104328 [Mycena vulgaris]